MFYELLSSASPQTLGPGPGIHMEVTNLCISIAPSTNRHRHSFHYYLLCLWNVSRITAHSGTENSFGTKIWIFLFFFEEKRKSNLFHFISVLQVIGIWDRVNDVLQRNNTKSIYSALFERCTELTTLSSSSTSKLIWMENLIIQSSHLIF